MKDSIMILGGANLHCKLVEAAHQMGKETVVVDNIKNSPAKLISDYSYDIDVREVDRLVDLCRCKGVNAVISAYLDFCQPFYQRICDMLGVPCFGTYEQFQIFTDKKKFKQICQKLGIKTILGYEESDLQMEDMVEYPVYIKPSVGQGSKGQSVCYTREDADRAIEEAKKVSGNGEVVIEKYMGNREILQITYLVIDGEPKLIRTADQVNGSAKHGLDHVAIAGVSPSVYTELFLEKEDRKVRELIKHVGIKNGPVFMQGFVYEGEILFFDQGLRFPGTEISRVYKKVMGMDFMQAMVEFAFTGNFSSVKEMVNKETVYLNDHIMLNFFPFIRKGKIKSIVSKEKLLGIEGVEHVTYRHGVGDIVGDTKDVNQRIAEINICGNSKEEVNRALEQVCQELEVLDIYGNNMIVEGFGGSDDTIL